MYEYMGYNFLDISNLQVVVEKLCQNCYLGMSVRNARHIFKYWIAMWCLSLLHLT